MVKHIVLFQLASEMEAERKKNVMDCFQEGVEPCLQNPFIWKIEVGLNANPEEQFDIALYSEFDTMDDVRAYAAHPAHLAVAALLKDCKKSRSCVDYECKA